VIRHFQLCMPYGVRGISDGILIGRHETTAHRLGRGRRGGKPDGGVCPATGGHPAPRQERSLYQPLARTDDGLGRPRCAARRFDLARI
jgi:hypothetical protein